MFKLVRPCCMFQCMRVCSFVGHRLLILNSDAPDLEDRSDARQNECFAEIAHAVFGFDPLADTSICCRPHTLGLFEPCFLCAVCVDGH
jgi:hypothetical protein